MQLVACQKVKRDDKHHVHGKTQCKHALQIKMLLIFC